MQDPDIQKINKRMLVSISQQAKALKLKEGDFLHVEIKDGGIFMRPVEWQLRDSKDDIKKGE